MRILFALVSAALFVPFRALAQGADVNAVNVQPCSTFISGLGCEINLEMYIKRIFLQPGGALFLTFFGVLFAAIVFYGFRLAFAARSESATTETTSAFMQALLGAGLVSGAIILADSFANRGQLPNEEYLRINFFARMIAFMVQTIGFILIANIFIQGVRLIVAINDGNSETARKNIVQSLIGAAIVMVSVPMLNLVIPGAFQLGINNQIVGIANFLGVIFGVLAVLAVIVAGIMLVISVDESLKDKARQTIIAALVSVLVVTASLAIITVLLPRT